MKFTERKRLLFFGLPWTFTKYTITEELITVNSGIIHARENDCYMYKVVDTRLCVSLLERLFGLGTIHCFGGDTTDPVLTIAHVKSAKKIKDFILEASEEERRKKRTLRSQDIGRGGVAPDFQEPVEDDF